MYVILTSEQHHTLLTRYPDDDILKKLKITYTFDEARKYADDWLMSTPAPTKLEFVKSLRTATNIGLYEAVQIYDQLIGRYK